MCFVDCSTICNTDSEVRMTADVLRHFLTDFLALLLERAYEARQRCKAAEQAGADPLQTGFDCGRALAYYEVISSFKYQAEGFGVAEALGTDRLDPDDLL